MEISIFGGFVNTVVVPAIAGSGVVYFLAKKIVEQRLSKDIETYKSELSEKTDTLKSQLSIYAHEQNIVATRIDGQRADAIKSVYKAICEWKIPTEKLVGACPVLDPDPHFDETVSGYYLEWARKSLESGNALIRELENQAIYFDHQLYEKLFNAVNLFNKEAAAIVNHVDVGYTVGLDYEDLIPESFKRHPNVVVLYGESIEPLYGEIVSEFRLLLGSVKQ